MNAIRTIWAWLAAGIARAWRPGEGAFLELAQSIEHERELAQEQDHCDPPARATGSAAQSQSAKRDAQKGSQERAPPIKILLGPRVDGGTAWTIRAPRPEGWPPIYTALIAALGRRSQTVELTDLQGLDVTFAISWGKADLVIQNGYTRIEISRRRAVVHITALASEVEGVRSWYLREIPRAVWWLLGIDLEDRIKTGIYGLGEATIAGLDALAPVLEQRRLEICVDAQGGIGLEHGLEQTVVSRLKTWLMTSSSGEVEGLLVGQRCKNFLSMGIYKKPEELETQRGPEHAALLERWREAGRVEGQELVRYELRLWGKALVLEGLDARRPSAALDQELIGRLWAHGLTQIRLVDPAHPAGRMRDKAEHPAWTALRDAGGHTGPLRLTRVAAEAQLDSTVTHARDRLAQAGADVEQLLVDDYQRLGVEARGVDGPGSSEGDIALHELGEAIHRQADWAERKAKAAARYEALLDSVRASS